VEHEVSAFRGTGGEVARHFVSLITLATALPMVVAQAIVIAAIGYLTTRSFVFLPVGALILLGLIALFVGRFAVAARVGELAAGFFSNGTPWSLAFAFASRYLLLLVAWGIPLVLAGIGLARQATLGVMAAIPGFAMSGSDGIPGATKAALAGVALMVLVVAGILMHCASLVVAARSDSVKESFSPVTWSWLWSRRADFVAFFTLLLGGMQVLLIYVAPLLLALSAIMVSASPRAGSLLGTLAWYLPLASSPILWGRLAGAFVSGEETVASVRGPATVGPHHVAPLAPLPLAATEVSPVPAAGERRATPRGPKADPDPERAAPGIASLESADIAATIQAARKLPVAQALEGLRVKAAVDLQGAIREADILRRAHATNPAVSLEAARLLHKAGRVDEAAQTAGQAIKIALTAGASPLAAEILQIFAKEREQLRLDGATLDQLGRVMVARNSLNEAMWCFNTLLAGGGDAVKGQKGLISVAEATARAGNAAAAAKIYNHILSKFPDSPFRDYVTDAKSRLRL
jgi:hypothetical protein